VSSIFKRGGRAGELGGEIRYLSDLCSYVILYAPLLRFRRVAPFLVFAL
jgi:hypothetical protein